MQEHVGLEPTYRRHLSTSCAVHRDDGLRPKSFLHDEMFEFNQIFAQLIEPKRHLSSIDECRTSESGALMTSHTGECCCSNTLGDENHLSFSPVSTSRASSFSDGNCRPNPVSLETYHEASTSHIYNSSTCQLISVQNID